MKKALWVAIAAAGIATTNVMAQELGPAVLESASDQRVQEEIIAKLYADHRLDGAMMNVAVHDGHVSITGTLKDQSQQAEIYKVARSTEGARDVFVFADEDGE